MTGQKGDKFHKNCYVAKRDYPISRDIIIDEKIIEKIIEYSDEKIVRLIEIAVEKDNKRIIKDLGKLIAILLIVETGLSPKEILNKRKEDFILRIKGENIYRGFMRLYDGKYIALTMRISFFLMGYLWRINSGKAFSFSTSTLWRAWNKLRQEMYKKTGDDRISKNKTG